MAWAVGWAVVETVGWVVAVASCGIVFVDWAFVTGWISGCVGCESIYGLGCMCRLGSC